jgi:hypothetical protein
VDVLGGALEFGEYGEVVASILCRRMRDLEEYGAVALDDQGAI